MKLLKNIIAISIIVSTANAFVIISPKKIIDSKSLDLKSSLSGSYSQGNEQKKSISLSAYFNKGNGKNYKNLVIVSYNYEENLNLKSSNRGMFHYRYTRTLTKKIDSEYFIQDEFDEFTNQKNRFIGGYNLRYLLPIISNNTFLGSGLFYSKILSTNTNVDKDQENLRLNLYLISKKNISDTVSLNSLLFYQPSTYNIQNKKTFDFSNYKMNARLSLENKITNNLSLEIGVIYKYNSVSFKNVLNEDLKTEVSLNYKIPIK